MIAINRRSALGLGAVAGLTFAANAVAGPRHRFARAGFEGRGPALPSDPAANPVFFWNGVGLDLIALDHSIDPADAVAPGPCASARALGVIHAVIADAVCVAYPSNYRPQFYGGPPPHIQVPPLFVGGAAAGIIEHIFDSPIHAYSIETSRKQFQRIFGDADGPDWQQGVAFASYHRFRDVWNWSEMRRKILPQFSTYIPRPRRHNIDPYNAGQGFYSTYWGSQEPLILAEHQIPGLAVPPPPPEGSPEYERDLAEVAVIGALESIGSKHFPARTQQQTNIGLFWAYDGVPLIGSPPRLYNQILRRIVLDDGLDVVEMARLFALYNLALAEAAIVAWWGKYKYAIWRPVLGIQNHAIFPIPDWHPLGAPKTNPTHSHLGPDMEGIDYVAARPRFDQEDTKYGQAAFTPNFPSYPSGHATFGGACFQILKLFRGERPETSRDPDRIDAMMVSDELNGVSLDNFTSEPRPLHKIHFTSIESMIRDNELSRIYLGIHWRFDQNRGTASGRRVAEAIYGKAYRVGRPLP
jgi:hypothetical protein